MGFTASLLLPMHVCLQCSCRFGDVTTKRTRTRWPLIPLDSFDEMAGIVETVSLAPHLVLPPCPASRCLSKQASVTGTPGLLAGQRRNSKKPLWLAVMSADTVMVWPGLYRRTIRPRPYLGED